MILGVIISVLERKGLIKPTSIKAPPPEVPPIIDNIVVDTIAPPAIEDTLHDMPQVEIQSTVSSISPAPRQPTPDEMLCAADRLDGSGFEKWCAQLFVLLGFSSVEMTKASGDQGVDIVATKDDVRYAIQCKCYSSDIGNHSVQEVHAGKSMYACHVGVVITNRYFTPSAKELAKVTGVLLWDRNKLKSIIQEIQNKNKPGKA